MRIAVSGTHYAGKTTLIEDLVEILPKYISVDEPYRLMEEEGYDFAGVPCLEDFEQQLIRSIDILKGSEKNIIFDRCPLDFVAYSLSLPDSEGFDLEDWLPEIDMVLKSLDLIVFVPLEAKDRIFVPHSEDLDLRLRVDEKLNEVLCDNIYDLDFELIQVSGNQIQRRNQVLARLA